MAYLEYNEKVLDHFTNPRHVGKIENPDAAATCGSPECGDYIELTLKIKEGQIIDVKYLVYGCAGAISTSSALAELAMGKKLEEAQKITDDDVILYLEGIPDNKKHCSLLGVKALQIAIEQFLAKRSGNK